MYNIRNIMSRKKSPRAFAIDTVDWKQHQLTFVSIESVSYIKDEKICPPGRFDRIAEVIDGADLTVVEYFTPELERTAYYMPMLGRLARRAIGPDRQYAPIAKIGHDSGARMGVADIANKPLYAAYAVLGASYLESPTGVHAVRPHAPERILPSLTDARRMLTAEAIVQEADRHQDGTRIAYIGAPAHVNRVSRYILGEQSWYDRRRLELYRHIPGLDKTLRVYEPAGDSWELTERHEILQRPLGSKALALYAEDC